MKLTIVQEGSLDLIRGQGGEDSVPTCSLLEHDGFRMLVDLDHPKHHRSHLEGALARLGLTPADIHAVAFTHLHPDHIGHKELFPQATFMFHAEESLRFFFAGDRTVRLSGPSLVFLDPLRFGRPFPVASPPDLTSLDGCLYFHPVPGHTRGSMALFVQIGGRVHVLAGDLFLDSECFRRRRLPACSWRPEMIRPHMEFVARCADVVIPGHGAPFATTAVADRSAVRCTSVR